MANQSDALDLDLRLGRIRQAQRQAQPRLTRNLRQLGAVGPYVPKPVPSSQQAIVHGWFGKTSATRGHLDYMQKGKGKDGQDAALFSRRNQEVSAAQFIHAAQTDPHQFRMSVSLKEQPRTFDFQRYMEIFMQRVERDLDRPLDWLAAVHHDTKHPHAHVILRGADRDGAALYITKDYLSHGMRHRASEIATILLGPQKMREREQSREPDRTPQHATGPAIESKAQHPRPGMDRQREQGMGW